jgi:hypothetical protein
VDEAEAEAEAEADDEARVEAETALVPSGSCTDADVNAFVGIAL